MKYGENGIKIIARRLQTFLNIMITCVILSGCGSSASTDSASYNGNRATATYDLGEYASVTEEAAEAEYYAAADNAAAEEAQEAGAETLGENAQTARKLIKTMDLYVETENYDTLLSSLDKQITALGGYIEYQYQYNGSSYSSYQETRNANMTVRIPVERLDEFIVKVGEWTNIINKEERVEDVTLRYVDLESRKKALLTEQARLLELLEQAESVEDVIAIEQRLSEVRYELESMESQLRTLDNQIDYTTIHLSIQEVRRLTPTEEKSAWDKMKNGFVKTIYQIGDDIEYGFISFVINIPYIIIWIVVIVIVFLLFRKFWKRRKRKLEALQQERARKWEENWNDRAAEAQKGIVTEEEKAPAGQNADASGERKK